MLRILDNIKKPNDIKKVPKTYYEMLAEQTRKYHVKHVSNTGGHLSSNLGKIGESIEEEIKEEASIEALKEEVEEEMNDCLPHMDNCYYVGKVSGERIAAIIGNTWTAYKGAVIENCYSATDDELLLVNGRASVENSSSPITYKNNYFKKPVGEVQFTTAKLSPAKARDAISGARRVSLCS